MTLSLPETGDTTRETLLTARADAAGFRIERLGIGARRWLRAVAFDRSGDRWCVLASPAEISLAVLAGDPPQLLIVGTQSNLVLPIAAASTWRIDAAAEGETAH